jgi:hypothetical protein
MASDDIIGTIILSFFLAGIVFFVVLLILFFTGNSALIDENTFFIIIIGFTLIFAVWQIFSSPKYPDSEITYKNGDQWVENERIRRSEQELMEHQIDEEKERHEREVEDAIIKIGDYVSRLEDDGDEYDSDEYDDDHDRSNRWQYDDRWVNNYNDVLFGTRRGRSKR